MNQRLEEELNKELAILDQALKNSPDVDESFDEEIMPLLAIEQIEFSPQTVSLLENAEVCSWEQELKVRENILHTMGQAQIERLQSGQVSLGKVIAFRRKDQRVSAGELAEISGSSSTDIDRFEQGKADLLKFGTQKLASILCYLELKFGEVGPLVKVALGPFLRKNVNLETGTVFGRTKTGLSADEKSELFQVSEKLSTQAAGRIAEEFLSDLEAVMATLE